MKILKGVRKWSPRRNFRAFHPAKIPPRAPFPHSLGENGDLCGIFALSVLRKFRLGLHFRTPLGKMEIYAEFSRFPSCENSA